MTQTFLFLKNLELPKWKLQFPNTMLILRTLSPKPCVWFFILPVTPPYSLPAAKRWRDGPNILLRGVISAYYPGEREQAW